MHLFIPRPSVTCNSDKPGAVGYGLKPPPYEPRDLNNTSSQQIGDPWVIPRPVVQTRSDNGNGPHKEPTVNYGDLWNIDPEVAKLY